MKNHVYGTFTAAKERIVEAGRKRAALLQNDGGGEEIVFTDEDERDNPQLTQRNDHCQCQPQQGNEPVLNCMRVSED